MFESLDKVGDVWGVGSMCLSNLNEINQAEFLLNFNSLSPCAFVVHIDSKQTYLPKIMSRITETGSMESNPIDQMSPEINYLKGVYFDDQV